MISLSRERRIETMCLFVWELGEKRKESVYYDFSSRERGIERMDSLVLDLGGEEERVCLL